MRALRLTLSLSETNVKARRWRANAPASYQRQLRQCEACKHGATARRTRPYMRLSPLFSLMAGLMVCNSGRMVAAMAMITSSVSPQRRGGFLSANSSVQHLAIGFGSYVGGLIIAESPDGRLLHFPILGLLSAAATMICLWLAGRIRPVTAEHHISTNEALAAAAEAMYDGTEPVACENGA